MKSTFYIIFCCGVLCGTAFAADPPGIPEPPLVIYGTVTDGGTNQPVTITSVTWQVTDGSESATLSAASTPPARVIIQSGQSFYLAEIPFDTRTVQNPVGQPLTLPRNGQSLELKSPGPGYTLIPVINGRRATIRSIGSTPASSATLLLSNSMETFGRMLRVELALPPLGSYVAWALTQFPDPDSPDAAPTADLDYDGQTNEAEFVAGTDPLNSESSLRLSSVWRAPNANAINLSWFSVAGKSYQLERAFTLKESDWQPVGLPIAASSSASSAILHDPIEGSRVFYRVRALSHP